MEIKLARPGDLHAHEAPQPRRVLEVARDIAGRGYLLRPVIVERRTYTIIDGHHRVEALKLLGARRIPVVEAEYGKEVTGLRPVLRTVPREIHGWKADRIADILEALAPGSTEALLLAGRRTILLRLDLEEAYRLTTPPGQGSMHLLLLPPLSPRSIVRAAQAEAPYPPKTTNHETLLKNLASPVRLTRLL